MSLTYTPDELRELSDAVRPSAICRWLDRHRIPYVISAKGWPKVLRSAILDQQPKPEQASEPRLRLVK